MDVHGTYRLGLEGRRGKRMVNVPWLDCDRGGQGCRSEAKVPASGQRGERRRRHPASKVDPHLLRRHLVLSIKGKFLGPTWRRESLTSGIMFAMSNSRMRPMPCSCRGFSLCCKTC